VCVDVCEISTRLATQLTVTSWATCSQTIPQGACGVSVCRTACVDTVIAKCVWHTAGNPAHSHLLRHLQGQSHTINFCAQHTTCRSCCETPWCACLGATCMYMQCCHLMQEQQQHEASCKRCKAIKTLTPCPPNTHTHTHTGVGTPAFVLCVNLCSLAHTPKPHLVHAALNEVQCQCLHEQELNTIDAQLGALCGNSSSSSSSERGTRVARGDCKSSELPAALLQPDPW
jgi:hypothetical protein